MDGHVRVDESRKPRRFVAQWRDASGRRHKRVLGPAHVKFSGRRNSRGGKVWHAGDGPCPDGYITPKRAQELLAEYMASTLTERDGADPDHVAGHQSVVLAELFGALLERRRRQGRAPSTVADYEDMSQRLGRELGHDTPVAEIDAQRLERMVVEFTAERRISDVSAAQRRGQGATVIRRDGQWIEVSPAAPRTIQKYVVWLHAAFKLALKKDWVAVNPVADMDEDLRPRFKRRELTRDEFYSPAEVALLLAACEEERQRALLGLACYAGLRLGEIRGLRVGGVDFASERLHISDNIVRSRLKKPKSGGS